MSGDERDDGLPVMGLGRVIRDRLEDGILVTRFFRHVVLGFLEIAELVDQAALERGLGRVRSRAEQAEQGLHGHVPIFRYIGDGRVENAGDQAGRRLAVLRREVLLRVGVHGRLVGPVPDELRLGADLLHDPSEEFGLRVEPGRRHALAGLQPDFVGRADRLIGDDRRAVQPLRVGDDEFPALPEIEQGEADFLGAGGRHAGRLAPDEDALDLVIVFGAFQRADDADDRSRTVGEQGRRRGVVEQWLAQIDFEHDGLARRAAAGRRADPHQEEKEQKKKDDHADDHAEHGDEEDFRARQALAGRSGRSRGKGLCHAGMAFVYIISVQDACVLPFFDM